MSVKKDNGHSALQPKSKIWLDFAGEVVFGGGRVALFQAVEETGSIRQAATKLGMSYRAAWGKIKATEERLGMTLVEKHAGGHQSGTTLTREAQELLETYRRFEEESVAAVDQIFDRHFAKLLSRR